MSSVSSESKGVAGMSRGAERRLRQVQLEQKRESIWEEGESPQK